MGLGYCSKVVSTVYADSTALQTFHPAGGTKRRHSALPAAAMTKKAEVVPAQSILNWVQHCKFGGHAQHTAAPYGSEKSNLMKLKVCDKDFRKQI